MSWFNKLTSWFGWETIRAKDEKGRFIADDKSTPDVDESKKRVYKSKSKARDIAAAKKPAAKKPAAKKPTVKKPVAKKAPAKKPAKKPTKKAYKPKTDGE
jgi:hypothetical protein